MAVSRDNIFGSKDRPSEKVNVPQWGGDVYVSTITGTERDAFESAITSSEGKVSVENIRAKLLVRCLTDENGNRLFTDADALQLGTKSANILDRLFTVARKLNGLSKDDVEELKKN